jgi:hypothetical protein
MTDENPDRSAAAANIPIIGIALIALVALLLVLKSFLLSSGFINVT